MTAICDGAADLASPRANTGTVPDHAILGSLVGFSHGVILLHDLIIAPFLCFGFAFTLDSSNSMACTDQSAAQIWPFPLVIDGV